ncbi:MAG: hypothetical protein ACKOC5_10225 [Chloroflexota bacterium]
MTTTNTTNHVTKAARLLILDQLQRAGLLDGLTYQQLGELLGCDRATAYRSLRDLATAQQLAPAMLQAAQARLELRQGGN